MLARKLSSDGRMRCPTPCRARNATRLPRSVPTMYGPEGSPNGVAIVFSSRSVSSAMSYRPLPPMMPISIVIRLTRTQRRQRTQRLTDRWQNRALAVRFPDVASGHRRIVREEHQNVLRYGFSRELLLRTERVHRIEVAAHDPRVRRVRRRRHQVGHE